MPSGLLKSVARRPVGLALGLFALGLGIGVGVALVIVATAPFGPRSVTASHLGDEVVHACVHVFTGEVRVMLPGREPKCSPAELLVEWAGSDVVAELAATVSTLQADFEALNSRVPGCLQAPDADTALFTGCNVQIVNGSENESTFATNGKGNLIVGYNEDIDSDSRNGSHNIVVGAGHSYDGAGGLVAGMNNSVLASGASVLGGTSNVAGIDYSVIVGGELNQTTPGEEENGINAVVVGGLLNVTGGLHAIVVGGENNQANGPASVVVGGSGNVTSVDLEILP